VSPRQEQGGTSFAQDALCSSAPPTLAAVPCLIILRYAILPKQVLAFIDSEIHDLHSYNAFYEKNGMDFLCSAKRFCCFVEGVENIRSIGFYDLCVKLSEFLNVFAVFRL
jgi:hypothetical protein